MLKLPQKATALSPQPPNLTEDSGAGVALLADPTQENQALLMPCAARTSPKRVKHLAELKPLMFFH